MLLKDNNLNAGIFIFVTTILILITMFNIPVTSKELSSPIIVDHNCTDLNQVPTSWIAAARTGIRIHYGHTSHGSQINTGLERLESQLGSTYSVAINWSLPTEANTLCILRQSNDPWNYYDTAQQYLDNNPTINLSLFGWCGQAGYANWQEILDEYKAKMQAFEAANPNDTFVYMTGNAQEIDRGGCRRHRFNEQLRNFCRDNNKVLFDFADLDIWYNNETNSYTAPSWTDCSGQEVPVEHTHYNGDEAGHTTYESCENKGKAFWWMLAKIAGWGGTVPVELTYMSASVGDNCVIISWETASETNCYGYNIYRSENKPTNFTKINPSIISCAGTSSVRREYSYKDEDIQSNKYYYYKIEQIDVDGTRILTSPIEIFVNSKISDEYNLSQNYPNPFNPETDIQYKLPNETNVHLTIFNVFGQKVKTLFNGLQKPGNYKVKWNGEDDNGNKLTSGAYIYRLKTDDYVASKKMLLFR
ncbi:T9SS type A sorting domain-containing protein [candidate division KSB1 bacterium]|nr:T9SS type A sorting domain-containing protein [candidate division KSB1 bacterium]